MFGSVLFIILNLTVNVEEHFNLNVALTTAITIRLLFDHCSCEVEFVEVATVVGLGCEVAARS